MPDSTESSSRTRERILTAAAAAFGELGFAGARVDDIAARAGANKASVYYHVGDKETLYAAVFGQILDHAVVSLREALAEVDEPRERFRTVIRALAGTASRHPHFAPLVLREIASGGSTLPDEVLQKVAAILGVVAEVLKYGADKGEFRELDPLVTHMTVAGGTLMLIAGTPLRERIRQQLGSPVAEYSEPSPDELPEIVASLIIDGLAKRPRPTRKEGA